MKVVEEQADLRVRRTRKLLWEALMVLMTEQAFEEITVREICDRAMVHRTTFYKHYADKYILLEQGIHQMYDVLVAEVHVPPSAFSLDHPPPYFAHLFVHVAAHQHFYRLMLCGDGNGRFQKLLKSYLAEQGEAIMRIWSQDTKKPVVPSTMRVQYMAGAVICTLAWWLEHDMPYSPQHMAQYLLVLHGTPSLHV